jgi:acetyl-CoA acetyltransferase
VVGAAVPPGGIDIVNGTGREVAITGIGYSAVTRGDAPDGRVMTVTACKDAMADAGITGADVDGVFQYSFGFEAPNAVYAQRALGIPNLNGFQDIMGSGPSGLAGAQGAAMAIASGVCDTAVVYRTMTQAAGHTGRVIDDVPPAAGPMQFSAVYGNAGGLIPFMGMRKRRYLDQYGRTEVDTYGRLAVSARKWSALNPRAALREPLSIDDYGNARFVAEPLRLFDCDYPINGTTAVVMTTAEKAADMAQAPVFVDSMAYGTGEEADWMFGRDFLYGGTIDCCNRLYAMSSIRPDELDVLGLYDGFTHITISWIEALGLCGLGEFGDWVDGGRTIEPGGSLPLNTSGGQLAEGRLHGLGLLAETVNQLRGTAGERQVSDARFAAVTNAHGPQCGAMLLRTEPD